MDIKYPKSKLTWAGKYKTNFNTLLLVGDLYITHLYRN